MNLLLDTQTLVWIPLGDRRLTTKARDAIFDAANTVLVSAVTAFEFADLRARGRFPVSEPLEGVLASLHGRVIELPAGCWRLAADLPPLHGDPVDRMMAAHAILEDHTVITAAATLRRYPIRTIW